MATAKLNCCVLYGSELMAVYVVSHACTLCVTFSCITWSMTFSEISPVSDSSRIVWSGFHLGFFVWGGKIVCKDQLHVCEACKVFEPIFGYKSPMHEKT